MPLKLLTCIVITACALLKAGIAHCHDFSGFIAAEAVLFPSRALFPEQREQAFSLAIQPEYYHELEDGSSFTAVFFLRQDSADTNRSHYDIRELNYLLLADTWEMRIGLGKVFWGVTEFVHLVDIINQSDTIESIDGEDKLGQPLVQLSVPGDWGTFDLFFLPWFRERTYPGTHGRLRNSLIVDVDNPRYQKGGNQQHVDLAFRYSATLGDWDLGLHYFRGIDREPILQPGINSQGQTVLFPFYHLTNQTGIDLQLVAGEWLWKLESIYKEGTFDDYFSATGGLEYTFTSVSKSMMDVGLISEFAYDHRRNKASTPMANDIMFGVRLNVNDPASSELLGGVSYDLDSGSTAFSVEASTRLYDNFKLTFEGYFLNNQPDSDLLYDLRDDDFFRVTLAYYF